jgi:hypothetical protein
MMGGHGMMGGQGMMGGMMGCPMMGSTDAGMTGSPVDPKVAGRLMQLRGEMMRLMADSMIQRGKQLEAGK